MTPTPCPPTHRGNLKVVIMNHSSENHLHIERGDKIALFILSKFETHNFVEVFHLDSTERGDRCFKSNGN